MAINEYLGERSILKVESGATRFQVLASPEVACCPGGHSLVAPSPRDSHFYAHMTVAGLLAMTDYEWDLFICHAWEDKESLVRPLAESLSALGLRVWYDQFVLRVGDSLLLSIDRGLANSGYGIVVISKALFTKEVPKHEFRGLLTRQLHEGWKVILPIWHGVTKEEVLKFSPSLADLLALRTAEMTPEDIGLQIMAEVRPDIYERYERADLIKLYKGKPLQEMHEELVRLRTELSDFQCPHCGALMEEHSGISTDDADVDRKVFACGYETESGWVDRPCPHATDVPEFEEFSVEYEQGFSGWSAIGWPRTNRAKRFHSLYSDDGYLYPYMAKANQTKEEAFQILYETYLRQFQYVEWRELRRRDGGYW